MAIQKLDVTTASRKILNRPDLQIESRVVQADQPNASTFCGSVLAAAFDIYDAVCLSERILRCARVPKGAGRSIIEMLKTTRR